MRKKTDKALAIELLLKVGVMGTKSQQYWFIQDIVKKIRQHRRDVRKEKAKYA